MLVNQHTISTLQALRPPTSGLALLNELRFVHARTPADKRRIFDTRERNYRGEHGYLLTEMGGQDIFDDHSELYGLMLGDRAVATCRLTRFGAAGWEASDVVPRSLLDFDPTRTVQISRVLVDREFRGNGLHVLLFYKLCEVVRRETEFTHYFGLCQELLMKLYSRIGACAVDGVDIVIPSRCAQPYGLVFGEIAATQRHLRKFLPGLESGAARTA